jgi:hypothetical protein
MNKTFTNEEINTAKRYTALMGIKTTQVEIKDDCLMFGKYYISRNDDGKCQAFELKDIYTRECGHEVIDVHIGHLGSFEMALKTCARYDFDEKSEGAYLESHVKSKRDYDAEIREDLSKSLDYLDHGAEFKMFQNGEPA